jgi:hypothetical protein
VALRPGGLTVSGRDDSQSHPSQFSAIQWHRNLSAKNQQQVAQAGGALLFRSGEGRKIADGVGVAPKALSMGAPQLAGATPEPTPTIATLGVLADEIAELAEERSRPRRGGGSGWRADWGRGEDSGRGSPLTGARFCTGVPRCHALGINNHLSEL